MDSSSIQATNYNCHLIDKIPLLIMLSDFKLQCDTHWLITVSDK